MSDGGSFAKYEEKTIEERLASLEKSIPFFQLRIQSYDKVLDEHKELKNLIEEGREFYRGLTLVTSKQSNKIDDVSKESLNKIGAISDQLKTHVNSLSDLKSQIQVMASDSKVFVEALRNDFESHRKNQPVVLNQYCTRDELSKTTHSILNNFSSLTDRVSMSDVKRNMLAQDVLDFNEKLKKALDDQSYVLDRFLDLFDQFHSFKKDIDDKLNNQNDYIKSQTQSIVSNLLKQMEVLRYDLMSSPSSIESIKNELLQKMDSISLDSQNASIRSVNTDKQLQLQERKIENIYLILKKNEFNK